MRRAATTSDRRDRWRRAAGAVVLALLVAGCDAGPDTRIEELHVFGATAELQLRGTDPAVADPALAEATAELARLHREWHPWEASDLTRINDALAVGDSAEAPPSLLALIARSRPLAAESGGLFDPAVGGLVAAWGFHTSVFPVVSPAPGRERIDAWRASRPRIDDVVVDGDRVSTRNRAVQLATSGLTHVAEPSYQRTLSLPKIDQNAARPVADIVQCGLPRRKLLREGDLCVRPTIEPCN